MIRALIVDDESIARDALRDVLAEDGDFTLLRDCKNGKEAVAAIEREHPDVVFLDVRMPVLDGFEVIGKVGVDRMPPTVFVTAYDSFAIKAFEAGALDYLLKPFDEDRVYTTLQRVKRVIQAGGYAGLQDKLQSVLSTARPRHLDRIPVRSAGRIVFLELSDIRWIESSANYLKFCTADEAILSRGTMMGLEAQLDPERFLRIHRSTIINVEHLKELRPWYTGEYIVIMNGGKELTLARRYRYQLQKLLQRSVEPGKEAEPASPERQRRP